MPAYEAKVYTDIALSIPEVSIAEDGVSFYTVELTSGADTNLARGRRILKRYSSLLELFEVLSRSHPSAIASLPPFPQKAWFGNQDPSFLNQRRVQLEAFLRACIDHDELGRCDAFVRCLERSDNENTDAPNAGHI
jgi:hypothetical protein